MDVVFDSTFLIDLFNPAVSGDQRAALEALVEDLEKASSRILIPAPCLTELLVHAGKAGDPYMKVLGGTSPFDVIPFDKRAATECALLLKEAWGRKTSAKITKTKFKYDWMVVACAASRNITVIYSEDADIARAAVAARIRVVKQSDLVVPAKARQIPLSYETPGAGTW
jgi:predicted nucleic acid-binding protein